MAKKKVSKKTAAKKSPKLCLRQIDPNTALMSADERFPEVKVTEEKLAKGYVRVDANTVVKTGA